ncbi:MAG: J domain-containing protein [Chloroflexi bacterium]|nr:J domain-containing protein [Chloroflexota bacterium]
MAKRDYYQVLGLSKNAAEKDIRQAYRRLARQFHPDLNPGNKGAEEKFKEINEAHEVLSNLESRKKYDQYGHEWKHADQYARASRAAPGGGPQTWRWEQRSGPGGVQFETEDLGNGDMGDLFGSLFGRGRRGRAGAATPPMRGEDLEQPVEVTLEEAYAGTKRLLGIQSEAGPRRLEVKIPPGVKTGSRVRIAGEGGQGYSGGPRGDLYLVVTVRPHEVFERKDDDLYVDVLVPLADAVLGGEVTVPTPSGKSVVLKIPEETQNGRSFRLGGKGMPHLGGKGSGDLYARVKVVLPTSLTSRERELFAELRKSRK